MRVGDSEYVGAWEEWINEEYAKDPKKPNEMRGLFGWFVAKEQEFKKKLEEENRLDAEV